MNNQLTPHEQLQSFLNKLFQFESQELDLGVYKILHYKRNEIKQFINELLVDKVKEQLQVLSQAQSQEALHKLQELEHDDIIKGWLSADENEKSTLLKFGKDKIEHYQELQQQVQSAHVSIETENLIYNHLTLFFSRYYDKGDFISKRRFGKNEKYVVPYNGEETHFYWANQDQYYIKSSESFQKYAFKVPHGSGNLIVNFKLTEAETEQGNVKANETRYFILSAKPSELLPPPPGGGKEGVLNIFFEYRSFTDAEKKTYTGNNKQDTLDTEAADKIKTTFKNEPLCINLWTADDKGENLLLQHLHRYTRKNSYDFFIHKNLKGFLQRELDFYIKSELVNVDDLYVSETDEHFNRIKHSLKTIKVFKLIADTIIEFLAQLEEFQKKLWEKKKFVLSTEWVITIDRLVEYIGIEAATPLLLEVIANPKQLDEWIDLFGKENIPACPLTIDLLKADAFAWRKYPIDTVHFPALFKENLLNALSAKINLEEKADGLVMHSDNYHGLNILSNPFGGVIDGIYIDPPYNTSASEIIYKNTFKHSSWLSLIENRINISKPLLIKDGIVCVTIDDFEHFRLKGILENSFGEHLGTICIRNNPSGRSTAKGVSIAHEYALLYSANESNSKIGRLERSEKQKNRYSEQDNSGYFEWVNFRKHGGYREESPKMYYPFYATENSFRLPSMDYDEDKKEWIIHEEPLPGETIIYPIDENGNDRRWKWGIDRVKTSSESEMKVSMDKNDQLGIYIKSRINDAGVLPLTWWDNKLYSATAYGTNLLN
ncbi:MAG TPA: DNA methyltransferase, partial [Bacteroidales bacterium]|nr:DNA methyltransferase [Bacteroidales bacterium]